VLRLPSALFGTLTVLALLLIYYFITHPGSFLGHTAEVSVTAGGHVLRDLTFNIVKTLGMLDVAGDSNWRHNVAGRPELFWPVGICFLLAMILTFKKFLKKEPGQSRFKNVFSEDKLPYATIIAWLIFAALPVVLSSEGIPHALRSALLIPPVFILAGFGAFKIYQFIQKILFEKFSRPPARQNFSDRESFGGGGTSLSAEKSRAKRGRIFHFACFLILALLLVETCNTYFILWGENPNVPGAFNADYVALGEQLNALPTSTPKYVVVKAGGVLVNGLPMPTQTTMFITDTFDKAEQDEKNIRYVLPGDENKIPSSSLKFYIR
jgi:hypothetical protein